jgi:hypothetical protein
MLSKLAEKVGVSRQVMSGGFAVGDVFAGI